MFYSGEKRVEIAKDESETETCDSSPLSKKRTRRKNNIAFISSKKAPKPKKRLQPTKKRIQPKRGNLKMESAPSLQEDESFFKENLQSIDLIAFEESSSEPQAEKDEDFVPLPTRRTKSKSKNKSKKRETSCN